MLFTHSIQCQSSHQKQIIQMMGKSLPLEKNTGFIGFNQQEVQIPSNGETGRGRRNLIDHCLEPQVFCVAQLHIQTFQKIKLSNRSKRPKQEPVGQAASSPLHCCSSFPGFCQPIQSSHSWRVTWAPGDRLTTAPLLLLAVGPDLSPKEAPAHRDVSAITISGIFSGMQTLTLQLSPHC